MIDFFIERERKETERKRKKKRERGRIHEVKLRVSNKMLKEENKGENPSKNLFQFQNLIIKLHDIKP